ncbi:MAG TPA: hypothetical protein VG028_05075 [Terriglobia bacterium]|nr:hypothetical protein [Terriglobia bacterium]
MTCVKPENQEFEYVKVLPYVGCNYTRANCWGVTMLVLGESHYMEEGEPGQLLDPLFTRDVVGEVLEGVKKPAFNFFTKVAGLFYGGRRPTENERCEFWRSVAFYSFVQVCVGNAPRQRPTSEMWHHARQPFKETLRILRPEFVLVLGGDLAEHLKRMAESETNVRLGDKYMPAWLYVHARGNAFAFRINHPSSRGWSYRDWEPWTQAAVKQAKIQAYDYGAG